MTNKTFNKVNKAVNIAYHTLALGFYSGYAGSHGKSLREEIFEYFRTLAKSNSDWRNILKTKPQKEHAVWYFEHMFKNEFGDGLEDIIPVVKEDAKRIR